MLQVGNIGLTLTEQYTHMTLWCIAGAPLRECGNPQRSNCIVRSAG